ncbi:hypothetical protein HF995_13500 [Sanguibacter hominis ATCC BAA-789]|uniref:Uncharacterized protein n=1 Tax=Sanguibacter hominis ATCC BAA-789 TaxID=1312740 RepID=A0A9X5FD29_9MICO|nr:hypothetical protein [Sanguibacter hominis]NKX94271.1 hypothetical protein [Sanguibacter hominis ATCC BAA-789]
MTLRENTRRRLPGQPQVQGLDSWAFGQPELSHIDRSQGVFDNGGWVLAPAPANERAWKLKGQAEGYVPAHVLVWFAVAAPDEASARQALDNGLRAQFRPGEPGSRVAEVTTDIYTPKADVGWRLAPADDSPGVEFVTLNVGEHSQLMRVNDHLRVAVAEWNGEPVMGIDLKHDEDGDLIATAGRWKIENGQRVWQGGDSTYSPIAGAKSVYVVVWDDEEAEHYLPAMTFKDSKQGVGEPVAWVTVDTLDQMQKIGGFATLGNVSKGWSSVYIAPDANGEPHDYSFSNDPQTPTGTPLPCRELDGVRYYGLEGFTVNIAGSVAVEQPVTVHRSVQIEIGHPEDPFGPPIYEGAVGYAGSSLIAGRYQGMTLGDDPEPVEVKVREDGATSAVYIQEHTFRAQFEPGGEGKPIKMTVLEARAGIAADVAEPLTALPDGTWQVLGQGRTYEAARLNALDVFTKTVGQNYTVPDPAAAAPTPRPVVQGASYGPASPAMGVYGPA